MAGSQGDIFSDSSDWDSSDDEMNTGGQQEPGAFNPGPQAVHLEANPDSPGFGVLNEYVMDHLLRFLPVNDLKNCRLVNSLWNEACLRVIPKADHVVKVPSGIDDITRLTTVISSSVQFPWTKFKLNCSGITTAKKERAVGRFFEVVAPFATSIHIYGWSTIPMLPGNYEYPALKQLKLGQLSSVQELGFGFVKSILENAPSLDELELQVGANTMIERWMELLEGPNARNISSLHLNSEIGNQHLIRLSELGLRLKYLYLAFHRNGQVLTISSESLRTFLQSQSAYLEELELMHCGYSGLRNPAFRQVEFPPMPKLTALKIGIPSHLPNISYSELFPVLRKLEFGVMGEEMEMDFFNEDIQPVESVTELIFSNDDVGCYEIMQGGRQFPNLRKLGLPNEQKFLECVSMSMPNVEELWLFCDDLDKDLDPGVCGITHETYEQLQNWPSSQLKVWSKYMEPPHCLKRLKKLRLIPRGYKLRLGEIGCRYGLLKLERLEILELVGDCSDVSKKAIKALRKNFTVVLRG